jgi:mono/diheme cytochrome c family protein
MILVPLLSLSLLAFGCRREEPARSEDEAEMLASSIEPLMPVAVRQAFSRSCAACHGPDGWGIIGIAPDLRKAPARGADQWEIFLRQTTISHPADSPPPVWLTTEESRSMAAWLVTIGGSP